MRPNHLLLTVALCLSIVSQGQIIQTEIRTPMPAQGRDDAVGFAIGDKGYIYGGRKADFGLSDELWAYAPLTDTWSLMSPLPGLHRQYASAWSIADSAFVICGLSDPGLLLDEVWCYDANQDSWHQKASFPGGPRFGGIAFELEGRYYFGLGYDGATAKQDIWQYHPASDTWSHAFDMPIGLYQSAVLELGEQVIIAGGLLGDQTYIARVWSYDGEQVRELPPLEEETAFADALSCAGHVLLIGGRGTEPEPHLGFLECTVSHGLYLQEEIAWSSPSPMADGPKRNGAVFSIGDVGFYFGGKDGDDVKSNALIAFSTQLSQNDLSLYPNPASDRISVRTLADKLQIFDLMGRQLIECKTSDGLGHISLDGLAAGTYVLRADDEDRLLIIE